MNFFFIFDKRYTSWRKYDIRSSVRILYYTYDAKWRAVTREHSTQQVIKIKLPDSCFVRWLLGFLLLFLFFYLRFLVFSFVSLVRNTTLAEQRLITILHALIIKIDHFDCRKDDPNLSILKRFGTYYRKRWIYRNLLIQIRTIHYKKIKIKNY